jgi:hypothetical protein
MATKAEVRTTAKVLCFRACTDCKSADECEPDDNWIEEAQAALKADLVPAPIKRGPLVPHVSGVTNLLPWLNQATARPQTLGQFPGSGPQLSSKALSESDSLVLNAHWGEGALCGPPHRAMPAPSARKCGAPCRSGQFAPSRYIPPHFHETLSLTSRQRSNLLRP